MSLAKGLVADVITQSAALIALMDREVEALRAHSMEEVRKLQPEKARLIDAYEAKLEALRKNPALFASVEPPVREELLAATRRLETATAGNAAALQAAKMASERLMQAVVSAAGEEVSRRQARGYAPPASRPSRRQTLSLALDRQL